MIVKQYVKDFEKLGFGLFVHFGLYSELGKGEWAQSIYQIPQAEYEQLKARFNPDKDWAKKLVALAKEAGCKYVNLTTRHHDGFSLYDTCGLNDYDAPHVCGRDLVREFVDACNEGGVIPFFYHTLFDWKDDFFERDFKGYLKYLRQSVEILCKNYGKIGGIWFDGYWKTNADWEEDALYGLIRKYQPDAMIINNTGLSAQGALGHIELDSVTFERGKPLPINQPGAPKYIAGEMCQVMNDHWGYAPDDVNYKSVGSLINDLVQCRRYHCNFLLNVGPMGDGNVRPIDAEILRLIGQFVRKNEEALYDVEPSGIAVDVDTDFILRHDNEYFVFRVKTPMCANPDVALGGAYATEVHFDFDKKILSACWLDNGDAAEVSVENGKATLKTRPYDYGSSYYLRVCKIVTEA